VTIVSNNQTFNAGSSGVIVNSLGNLFEQQMHTVLLGGRDIFIDLPPGQTACPANCKYNSTYQRYTGNGTALCKSCGGAGFIMEQRQTVYRANIRWTDEGLNDPRGGGEDTPAGKVYESLVRTKTHIASLNHINQSLGATIDGVKCTLWNEPRTTGWGNTLYFVVCFWKKANKKLSNG
jgi:hypothetical protein